MDEGVRDLIEKIEESAWFESRGSDNPYASPHGKGFVIEFYHQRSGKVLAWRRSGFMNVAKGMKTARVFKSEADADKFIAKEVIPHIKDSMSGSWEDQIHGWSK